jgi:hypothetical protein
VLFGCKGRVRCLKVATYPGLGLVFLGGSEPYTCDTSSVKSTLTLLPLLKLAVAFMDKLFGPLHLTPTSDL